MSSTKEEEKTTSELKRISNEVFLHLEVLEKSLTATKNKEVAVDLCRKMFGAVIDGPNIMKKVISLKTVLKALPRVSSFLPRN